MANIKPVKCWRCQGTGVYRWGPTVNGIFRGKEGPCFKCVGGGEFPRTESAVAWRLQSKQNRKES